VLPKRSPRGWALGSPMCPPQTLDSGGSFRRVFVSQCSLDGTSCSRSVALEAAGPDSKVLGQTGLRPLAYYADGDTTEYMDWHDS